MDMINILTAFFRIRYFRAYLDITYSLEKCVYTCDIDYVAFYINVSANLNLTRLRLRKSVYQLGCRTVLRWNFRVRVRILFMLSWVALEPNLFLR